MGRSGDDCEWEDRLQDWIDGELDAGESDTVHAHTARCASCRTRIDALGMLDGRLITYLPRPALDDEFNRRVLAGLSSVPRDLASGRARLERDWREQESALLRIRRRIRNWIILDVLAILLLIAVARTFWHLPDVSAWVDRLYVLAPTSGWSLSLSVAAISTIVALTLVGLLATTEHE